MFGGHAHFECLGGWRYILRDLFERIDVTLTRDEEREGFRISQVKEKYGPLRCYTNGDARVNALVEVAVRLSGITCDVCGGRGWTQGMGWLATRCDAHVN